jgi:drug/metabolite transporter (DMT)-like permease
VTKSVAVVPARVAASVQYLQPVAGVMTASAMFGYRIGASFAVGVALVLAGLTLTHDLFAVRSETSL